MFFSCHLQFLKPGLIIIITLGRQSISAAPGFLLSSNVVSQARCSLRGLVMMTGVQCPRCGDGGGNDQFHTNWHHLSSPDADPPWQQ